MSHSHSHSCWSFYSVPPLSAIEHASNPVNVEDGLHLPSSCYSRTWLLDNFQETCCESTSCQATKCQQNSRSEDSGVPSACFPRVIQTVCPDPISRERTMGPAGADSAVPERVLPSSQPGCSQQMGHVILSCQPVSYVERNCPHKTYVCKSCQTLEKELRQIPAENSESSSCRFLVCGTQPLESSSTYEPTCCVTGGLQLPSK
ncbi:keratin-associated protein 27-1 [Echinops telfairi]|uniref:Keratin-associated protein n=1 Tax=Echinops telfairi TaxID=9371 RepID=A0ABM0J266_ECHTE|nr:keratin-associated protein 27-1 [Echinops telfairi]